MQLLLGFQKSITVNTRTLLSQRDYQMPANGIPEAFDARKKWSDCPIDAIQDQSRCGSCWVSIHTIDLIQIQLYYIH